jgi:hypothetical protein
MANSVLIIGDSGTGKSTSIENLDPKSTFVINVASKRLPFKGFKTMYTPFNSKSKEGNIVNTCDIKHILAVMDIIDAEMPHIKNIIVEDSQYMSSFKFMEKSDEKGYDKFNVIGKEMYLLFTKPIELRDDLTVFYLNHSEYVMDEGVIVKEKAMSVGKMIDQYIKIEGLFTIVLKTSVKKSKEGMIYTFQTNTDGRSTAKSPRGMFENFEIPNDLSYVLTKIQSYEN